MRSSRKTFLVVLTGILLAGSLVTATTIITGDHPDGYELEPELLPSENINATNATLRVNLEQMDEVYDAALVYWNLTDTTTGETVRGPATTGFEQGETVEADYVGLEPDAEYTLQAYTEPVVWADDTLIDNFVEKGLSNVPEGSDNAMEAVADDINASTEVLSSEAGADAVWSSETGSEAIWEAGDPQPPNNYDSSTGIDVSSSIEGTSFVYEYDSSNDNEVFKYDFPTVNLTDINTIHFETELEETGGSFEAGMRLEIDGSTVWDTTSHHSWTSRSEDITSYSGESTISLVFYDDGTDEGFQRWRNIRLEE